MKQRGDASSGTAARRGGGAGAPWADASNLSVWASAFSLTNVTGTLHFSDPGSLSASNRFYRTSQP